jgi:hypothetical protein
MTDMHIRYASLQVMMAKYSVMMAEYSRLQYIQCHIYSQKTIHHELYHRMTHIFFVLCIMSLDHFPRDTFWNNSFKISVLLGRYFYNISLTYLHGKNNLYMNFST